MTETLPPPLTRFKFTVEDFYALAQLGLFEDHKVELWDGDIVEMSINPPHAKGVTRTHNEFFVAFMDRALVTSQNPLDIDEPDKLPQPDVMLLKLGDYLDGSGKDRHPKPHEVLLLVEISDSTLLYDQTHKLKMYAQHSIPEYWIADLNHQTWFVYREPTGDSYTFRTTYRFGEAFAPLAFPEVVKAWLA
jgi:Uma2 family endonuclease